MISTILAALMPILNPVDAVLTDIEGTTTSISFVHDTLFPYAKEHVREYVLAHENDPTVQKILKEVEEVAQVTSDQVIDTLLAWMQQDKKITPLKALQGLMWEDGYRTGAFQGHVYDDAFQQMSHWKSQGLSLYVYSSGSVHAQKLLFSFSNQGDMTPLFTNYFDTKVGGKKETASYVLIAEQIGIPPEKILFLSDTVEELNAARNAGMQTILLNRDYTQFQDWKHPFVRSFNEISIP